MSESFAEDVVEEAVLAWLEGSGYSIRPGSEIAPGEQGAERSDYGQVVLEGRLREALAPPQSSTPDRGDPGTPSVSSRAPMALAWSRPTEPSTGCLVDGVNVEYRRGRWHHRWGPSERLGLRRPVAKRLARDQSVQRRRGHQHAAPRCDRVHQRSATCGHRTQESDG